MQLEMCMLRGQLEEERYRVERLEEQLNDLTELHQHEMLNLKQDLASSEEKIEYRLDERTADLSDLVDSASTRVSTLSPQLWNIFGRVVDFFFIKKKKKIRFIWFLLI